LSAQYWICAQAEHGALISHLIIECTVLDLRSLDKHAASILHLIIECTVPDLCSLVEHAALISHLIIECTVLDLPVRSLDK
jgi:hypothetical protein